MKLTATLFLRLRWLNLPGALLLALLQRTPALRVASLAAERLGTSPLGVVLRSAFATTASLGALHSLAGATQLQASTPTPLSATVGVAIPSVVMTVTGAQSIPASFLVTGPIPPGLSVSGLTGSGGSVNASSLVMTGTPTTAGTYRMTVRAWQNAGMRGDSSSNFFYTVNVTGGTSTVPAITTQPVSQTVLVGATVTFTAAASGSPAPAFQWRKDGTNISGATGATLTLSNVTAAAAGGYSVVATNTAGSAVSSTATLVVNSPPSGTTLPAFASQPKAQSIASGSTVVLSASVTGATNYQWSLNGAPLLGATSALLILNSTTDADAGNYTLAATNSAGTITSTPATLSVVTVDPILVGRLVNLSVLTTAGSGAKALTIGATIGGRDTVGSLPLVIRAIGPSLANFGITTFLADPMLALNTAGNTTPFATNDNWGGGSGMVTAFANVAAFALPTSSLDSAIVRTNPGMAAGGYTMQVTSSDGSSSGTVLAELYDATGNARVATTPRFTNISTLTQIDAGANLAVGFVIGGTTARTLLVRGVGPSLIPLGVGGTMADPKLELYDNSTGLKLTENNDWGSDSTLAAAQASVGAFGLANSKDAVLLVTLPPGQYSARVLGADGGGGTAIVEVYEVP